MFHVKHSAEQSNGTNKRKATLVIGILAVIAVLLGIVLVVAQPSGETASTKSSTAPATTEIVSSKTPSDSSGNTTNSGITRENTQNNVSNSNESQADDSPTRKVDFSGYEYEPGIVLATPAEGTSVEEVASTLGVESSQVKWNEAGFLEITLSEGMSVEEAVEILQDSDAIESAQPDFVYELQEEETLEQEPTQVEPDEISAEEPATAMEEALVSTTQQEASDAQEDEIEDISSTDEEIGLDNASESISEGYEVESESDSSHGDEEEELVSLNGTPESTSSPTERPKETPKTNDPRLSEQWALDSINAFDAWELLKRNQKQRVSVAVIDEGFELTHEDLQGNLIQTGSGSYASYNVVSNDNNVSEMDDANYHGTHVAGIIAAKANNGLGIAGVSYNQTIVPIKAFYLNSDNQPRTSTRYITAAYAYIMEHRVEYNIRVANISFGIFAQGYGPDIALEKAIDEACNAGIATVASAGNEDSENAVPNDNYPSDYSKVVAVINLCETQATAKNPQGVKRYGTSNYNRPLEDDGFEDCKNIAAPGTSILSSTYAKNGYNLKTGTSMAAPYVSGVLAMMFAVRPELSTTDAIVTLYATATDLGPEGFDAETGYGEVNAAAAVKAVVETAPAGAEPPAKPAEWSAGATKMPVGSTSKWKLKNCTLKVVAGSGVVSIAKNGRTVKARKTGAAKLAIIDSAGTQVASKTVRVYKLAGKHAVCNVGKGKARLAVVKNSQKIGAKAVLTKSRKAKSAKLKLIYKNGYYQFMFTHSGKLLKIKSSNKKQNTPAIQALSFKSKATQWKVTVDSKNRLTFVNRNSGKVLAAKGKAVVQRKQTGAATEKWLVK